MAILDHVELCDIHFAKLFPRRIARPDMEQDFLSWMESQEIRAHLVLGPPAGLTIDLRKEVSGRG